MEILRNFAVFEEGDGSGTTTHLTLLKQKFITLGYKIPVLFPTAEPTGASIGLLLRSALKNDHVLHPGTLTRLFATDRGSNYTPKTAKLNTIGGITGHLRPLYPFLTVFQGIECGETFPRSLNSPFPAPELLLFLDFDYQIAQERLNNRPSL
jgi:dTMP kinase